MATRFTDSAKWQDPWFSDLLPLEKLVFIYICDSCDVAGFYEISAKRIAFEIGESQENILGAIKGLGRGLLGAKDGRYVWVRNFIKHQKNLQLNPANNAHKGTLSKIEEHQHRFDFDILSILNGSAKPPIGDEIIENNLAPSEGLTRGIGKGNGKGKPLLIPLSLEKVNQKESAIASQQSDALPLNKIQEEKKKPVRSKAVFVPPTKQEVFDYAKQREFGENSKIAAKQFYEFYDAGQWLDSKQNPVKNWKQKFLTWESRDGFKQLKLQSSGCWTPEKIEEMRIKARRQGLGTDYYLPAHLKNPENRIINFHD